MTISVQDIKKLRDMTGGLSMAECKSALEEAGGDMEKAVEILKAKGAAIAAKKGERELKAGSVQAYVHGHGTVGSLAELLCETDFVARNDAFQSLAKEVAMQVAATDEEVVEAGTEEFLKQPAIRNPETTIGGMIEAAVQKFGERIELGRIMKFAL